MHYSKKERRLTLYQSVFLFLASVFVILIFGSILTYRSVLQLAKKETEIATRQVVNELLKPLFTETDSISLFSQLPLSGNLQFDPSVAVNILRSQTRYESMTETGIPIASVAAVELAKRTGHEEDGILAGQIALIEKPSVITPLLMARLEKIAQENAWDTTFSFWRARWERDEDIRSRLNNSPSSQWLPIDGAWCRVVQNSDRSVFVARLDPQSPIRVNGQNYHLKISSQDKPVDGELWGSVDDLGFVIGLQTKEPQQLQASFHNKMKILLWMLLATSIIVIAASWFMLKAVKREKEMAFLKDQIVASVSHELRAPVGSIQLITGLLKSGDLPPDQLAQSHEHLSNESFRLSTLIENILDLASIEAKQRAINRTAFNFNNLIDEVFRTLKFKAQEKEISLRKAGKSLEVVADQMALSQILINLVENAIKFSPSRSHVIVNWGEGWWFSVTDEGPGIVEKKQKKIFERFFREESEIRRQTSGTGIGLALVKDLVDLMGGEIFVTCHKGTTFKIQFDE